MYSLNWKPKVYRGEKKQMNRDLQKDDRERELRMADEAGSEMNYPAFLSLPQKK